jgi:hypothetical protein
VLFQFSARRRVRTGETAQAATISGGRDADDDNRLAFQFGRQTALRSTNEVVDQLQAQIERLQEQLKFNAAEHEREIAVLLRDLTQAKYELARRDISMRSPARRARRK